MMVNGVQDLLVLFLWTKNETWVSQFAWLFFYMKLLNYKPWNTVIPFYIEFRSDISLQNNCEWFFSLKNMNRNAQKTISTLTINIHYRNILSGTYSACIKFIWFKLNNLLLNNWYKQDVDRQMSSYD